MKSTINFSEELIKTIDEKVKEEISVEIDRIKDEILTRVLVKVKRNLNANALGEEITFNVTLDK